MRRRALMAIVVLSVAAISVFGGQTEEISPAGSDVSTPLKYDYYEDKCGDVVESIVWSMMQRIVVLHPNAPAQLLRLLFHDCFIRGCDASVLLAESNDNKTVEREAIPNRTLKGFSFIEMTKDEIEEACPGVVSCSDILVIATRDAIILAGGPFYPVLTGRRDSIESFFTDAMAEIPRPAGNISETLRLFSLRGFDARETVALLGGHNIGTIGCEFIKPRLNNFMGTSLPDPSIPTDFLEELKLKCLNNSSTTVNNMLDEHKGARSLMGDSAAFDNHYYRILMRGRGLLFADQQLMADEKTAAVVIDFAVDDGATFRTAFAHAMTKLSEIGVLTGLQGQIRSNCSRPNSN